MDITLIDAHIIYYKSYAHIKEQPRVPGVIPQYPLASCHYLVLPPTTQMAVIMSPDGTYNVYMHLRL